MKEIIAFLYGFLVVNYLDNIFNPSVVRGWHLWLSLIYAVVPLLVAASLRELAKLYVLVSLVNDLTYAPFRMMFIDKCVWMGKCVNLLEWYAFQLGLYGFKKGWMLDYLFFQVPVISIVMGISIYARIAIICILEVR